MGRLRAAELHIGRSEEQQGGKALGGTCQGLKGQAGTKRLPLSQEICGFHHGLNPCKSFGIAVVAQVLCSCVTIPAKHMALKRK